MNTRTLFFTAVLIAALALGAGLMLAQDGGGGDDDAPASAREHSGFGRGFRGHDRDGDSGAMWRGRGPRGFAGRGMGMPAIGADMLALATEATGLERAELYSALRAGNSLASLIEAGGGDVAAFIAGATELVSARVNEGISARIEALVRGERPAGTKDMDGRGFGKRGRGGPQGFGGRDMGTLAADALEMLTGATGLEARELFGALREGSSLASLIEAEGGDVAAFIAGISEAFSARVDAAVADGSLTEERAALLKDGMAERIEAMVNAEHLASGAGRDWRGRQRDKDEKSGGKEHGGREGKAGAERAEAGGEESGTMLALDEGYDSVRNGIRLVMSWDAAANAFSGSIENTSDADIQQVRVEVHLSNSVELGPTPTVSLAPGETRAVRLDASGQDFEGWSAHAETGSGEHSGEGEGEHGGRAAEGSDGEHGSEGSESAQG